MKAVIFDLDGTLLYTLGDIAAALNSALREHGLAEQSITDVRNGVGHGLRRLVDHAVDHATGHVADHASQTSDPHTSLPDIPAESRQSILSSLKRYYRQNPTTLSYVYEGIPEIVDAIHNRGMHIGVLSNKDNDLLGAIVQHFFPGHFSPCFGMDTGLPPKPDPAVLQKMIRSWDSGGSIGAQDVLFVGDSEVDLETAQRAGTGFVGVAWGYRGASILHERGATHIIHSPQELLPFL